jgi:DNA-binding SARP family transcriptional activator
MLELTLLGVPQVRLDGRVVAFKRLGSVTLLAYLALSTRTHAREVIASLLAGDNPDDQARKLLSNLLVDLRHHVGDYVIATRRTVRFNHSWPYTLDVAQLQTQAAGCDRGQVLEDLEAAIHLYRGEFLEGLCPSNASDFASWQSEQREELRGLYMRLLRAHVDACLELGAWDRGIQSARRTLAQEPWQELAHRQLMMMLARSGQRHAAIAQYLTCRRTLLEEIGVYPSPETVDLFNRVRGAAVPPPHNLPHPSTPFVGRATHVRQLSDLLSDPSCRLATITGLAGSGKTALALQVARGFAAPETPPPEQPFPDGVFLVNFAEVGELPLFVANPSNQAMLLVLDNFNPAATTAAFLPRLLARAPQMKLLVTSSAPLNLAGERVVHIDGLQVPATEDELETADASALFLQEARRVALNYGLSDRDRSALVALCQLLGGFPLAMVLAARWTPVQSCSAIVSELNSGMGLDVLATTDPDLPKRHRNITCLLERAMAELGCDIHSVAQLLDQLTPELKLLNERRLVSANTTSGTLELHPLLRAYVNTAPERRGAPRLVA